MEVHRLMHNDERDPHHAGSDQPPDEQPAESAEANAEANTEASAETNTEASAEENAPSSPSPPDEDAGPPPSDAEAWVAPMPADPASSGAIPAHSVPATPLGEGTRCSRCGTDNRPGIAFCRSCGQRLIEAGSRPAVERPAVLEGTAACPRCGTHNRAGVAFCQNCGANLRPVDGEPEAVVPRRAATRAVLGPVVLLIGAAGMVTAWLLPFTFGGASLWDRSFGAPGGYGAAFWTGYSASGSLVENAYFGLAAPVPILLALLVLLAGAGVMRAAPGSIQRTGLIVTLLWAIGLAAMFVVVELLGGPGGDLVAILRALSPAGIIFLLAGLIVMIGSATRLWRG
jgi:hypothetical protein